MHGKAQKVNEKILKNNNNKNDITSYRISLRVHMVNYNNANNNSNYNKLEK